MFRGEPPPSTSAAPLPPTSPVDSALSVLRVARILAIVLGILQVIVGLSFLGFLASVGAPGWAYLFSIFVIVWSLVDFGIAIAVGGIREQVTAGKFQEARSALLLWVILGFVLGGIILGVVLLLAYVKLDLVIIADRTPGSPLVGPASGTVPQATAPPLPPPPPDAPLCARCAKPATYIPRYGRYYCYEDKLYVELG